MARSHVQSRRHFGPFLLEKLESGTTEGISWLDREDKLFTISWADNRGKGNSWVNPIFKEWEVYKGRYKEGEKKGSWKQTFKSALDKCPDVERMLDMCGEKDPVRLYRFGYAVSVRGGTLYYNGLTVLPSSQESTESYSHLPKEASTGDFSGVMNCKTMVERSNIPIVVTEELNNNNSPPQGMNTVNNSPPQGMNTVNNSPPQGMNTVNNSPPQGMNTVNNSPPQGMNTVHNSPSQGMNTVNALSQVTKDASISISRTENGVNGGHSSSIQTGRQGHIGQQHRAESTLKRGFNEISAFTLDSDEWNEMLPPNLAINQGPLHISGDIFDLILNESTPYLKYQVYYNHLPVLSGSMKRSSSGLRLFYGFSSTISNVNLMPIIGPKFFEQKELPDVDSCKDLSGERKHFLRQSIQSVLDKMSRGLLLCQQDGQLKVLRLCSARVFSWNNMDGGLYLDRSKKAYQVLFDMKNFAVQLDAHKAVPQNKVCPSPTVTLTFGQEYTTDNLINKKLLVHVDVTVVEAEELLHQEIPFRCEPQFSGFDSGDMLLELMRSKLIL